MSPIPRHTHRVVPAVPCHKCVSAVSGGNGMLGSSRVCRVCRPSPPLECNTQWVRHQDMTGFWVWHQDIIGCVRQAMSSRVCRVTSVAVLGMAVLAVSCQPCQPLRPCWPCHVDYSSRVSYFRFGRVANEHQTFVSCLNSATGSWPCRVTPRHY